MPDWLADTKTVNLTILLLTVATLVFTIVSSDKGIALIKKTSLVFGRAFIGIVVMSLRVFLLAYLLNLFQENSFADTLDRTLLSNTTVLGILIVLPGTLTALIASSGVNKSELTKRSIISAVITTFLASMTVNAMSFSSVFLSINIFTGLLAGLIIAPFLIYSGLWTYQGGFSIRY